MLGAVLETLDGLGSWGFDAGAAAAGGAFDDEGIVADCAALALKYDGGKCFAL